MSTQSATWTDDEGYARYFSYLNLFLFFMSVLVLAGNALMMFIGWEGVGLASYLLIGFYFQKKSAADAGKKAFIVNRIGDVGFLFAMFLLVANFGTLTFTEIAAKLGQCSGWTGGVVTVIALCLLLGAAGKSAQLPLYIWLPDAMEGPTPVSALIHAATMVTAGVYMIARMHVLFNHSPFALGVVALVGAATALFAATIGLAQNDIKRVLAYSTISQLGYMFLACGVAAYSAAIFHLLTHAFFKALLFLAAGAVIHSLGGEQDLRRMGGLWKKLPVTFAVDHGRRSGHCRIPSLRRILLQGRDSLRGVFAAAAWARAVGRGRGNGAADFVLYVPAVVHGLPGQATQ
jgi:NADH-quinone oxidoreductase subunit L